MICILEQASEGLLDPQKAQVRHGDQELFEVFQRDVPLESPLGNPESCRCLLGPLTRAISDATRLE